MTSAPSHPAAARLHATAFALLAALPLAMALANRSAPLLVTVAAILATAGRLMAGESLLLRSRFATIVRRPVTLACLAFCLFALVSIGWSHEPRAALAGFGELALAAVAPVALHLALPRRLPSWITGVAAALLALGCVTILGELGTDMAVRRALGLRPATFIFKRSVAAMLLVYWPVASLLWSRGWRLVAVGLGLLLAAAIVASHAGAALIGFATGLVGLGLAAASRRAGVAALALGLGVALATAPVVGDLVARALPERALDRLESVQARDRIAIWQSFGSVVALRPLGGIGFGTSARAAQDPVAAGVPAERQLLLGAGHPHDGYLQVWAETGLVGALLAAIVLACLVAALARAPRAAALPGAAAIASAATIMLVGHGAWQGWWIAMIGAAAVWCGRLPES